MATVLGVVTILIVVLAMIALVTSIKLGRRFQSLGVLVLGLLVLGSTLAGAIAHGFWGPWDVVIVATAAAVLYRRRSSGMP
jgi:hypothetical protein